MSYLATRVFGDRSRTILLTCDPRLQRVFNEVVKHYDCQVLVGYRNKADQDEAVRTGHSKLPWPKSGHNTTPARAVDVAPYPIDWKNRERFAFFAGFVVALARGMGIQIRSGADWNDDGNPVDDGWDMPHFELLDP